MSFNTLLFAIFFALVLLGDRVLPAGRSRKLFLLGASYLFYAAWNPPFVLLIWLSTAIDWWVARALVRVDGPRARRGLVATSLVTNLGLLGYFKYGGFVVDQLAAGLHGLGVAWSPPPMSIVLPVGISFYTFQTLSYTLDVYRRRIEPAKSAVDFALYVTFFPQLVAGPIVRARDFLPQCEEPRRARPRDLGWGLSLVVLGLFEKVFLADALMAPVVETAYLSATLGTVSTLVAWSGAIAFSSQIFCDFAGYSTTAIGVALCLGFRLPDNFRWPYGALGFSDFWRRWHVSLSTWLRDYLYISLGGNRRGGGRTLTNLMLTMLLGGLWHGASWLFVLWGGLHGLCLVLERVARARFGATLSPFFATWGGRMAGMLATWAIVTVAWVFFRAPTLDVAFAMLRAMGGLSEGAARAGAMDEARGLALAASALLVLTHMILRDRTLPDLFERLPGFVQVALLSAMALAALLVPGEDHAFIYFQF